jgi:signal transduction histidine kinase
MPDLLRFFALPLMTAAACVVAVGREFHTPYQPDPQTLHLWHLDEAAPPFTDQAGGDGLPLPLLGLLNGARARQPAPPGLGHSISFHSNAGGIAGAVNFAGAILTAAPLLSHGPGDNAPAGFRYFGPDGAFTYEAVLKLHELPDQFANAAASIISMEGEDGDRIFNFRIEREGFLSFIPLPDSGAKGLALATIPLDGPHAIDTSHWFHVAVSYDGNAGVAGNLQLHWTRLAPGIRAAHRIGSGTLTADLNGRSGDFAIGNEARGFEGNAEAEPFPGLIDEVRISSVARHPSDYFFVPPGLRVNPERASALPESRRPPGFDLRLASVLVDASSAVIPSGKDRELRLGSGLHRLDFEFGFGPGPVDGDVKLRCQLEGIDERWQETEVGMSLICQALDAENNVISQTSFPFIGRSAGWETTLDDSTLTRRVEPVFIPSATAVLRLTLSSGSPDTTGFVAVDRLALAPPGSDQPSLWARGSIAPGEDTIRAAGAPAGWRRDGTDPAIARLLIRSPRPMLSLVDGDQSRHGEWSAVQQISPPGGRGGTFILSWEEAYNVVGGHLHRATYVNVPPGRYVFRAIGLAGESIPLGDGISLPVVIAPPVWRRAWFWPGMTAAAVGLLASGIFARHRRRSRHRLEILRFQNALERDRTRIARDLHDDLGTRVTVLNMTADLARRDLELAPVKARRHLDKISDSARELVVAMDDLVWAVDPLHDTLDHLASHLTRLAEEMFRDSPLRCRLDIPSMLPSRPLGSDFRHHIALAVKESLHNALRHAGPCEVFLSLRYDGETMTIVLRDSGCGFDLAARPDGHGLGNTAARIREIGGACTIESSPGQGTCITMTARLPESPVARSHVR